MRQVTPAPSMRQMRTFGGLSPAVAPKAQASVAAAVSTRSATAWSTSQSSVRSASSSLTGDGYDRFSTIAAATTAFGRLTRLSSGVSSRVLRQVSSRTEP